MNDLPVYQTNLVPMGTYIAEVTGAIKEKISTFDLSRRYYVLPLRLVSENGEDFLFAWSFTERSPMLADFLLAIGGRRLPSGNIQPPPGPYTGRKVRVSIGQRTAKGSSDGRVINEVLAIYRYEEIGTEARSGEGTKIPF